MQANVRVVRATAEHAEALASFFRAVWDPAATAEGVRRARQEEALHNPASGGDEPPTFLVLADDAPIGFVTTIAGRLWNGEEERIAYWLKGLMVLPEHRNGPVGFLVMKEAIRHLPCAFAMAVASPARRLFQGLKFTDLGAMPNRILLLNPGQVANRLDVGALGLTGLPSWVPRALGVIRRTGIDRLGGLAVRAGRALWAGAASLGTLGMYIANECPAWEETEVDHLWEKMRRKVKAGQVRDGRFLHWRYRRREPHEYRLVTARRQGTLVAIAAVRLVEGEGDPRLRGLRVGTLSDLLFDPEQDGAGLAALAGAERLALRLGADALLCGATHPDMLRLLVRRGYLRIPGNVHVMVRDATGQRPLPQRLDQWWVTRGDGEADEV